MGLFNWLLYGETTKQEELRKQQEIQETLALLKRLIDKNMKNKEIKITLLNAQEYHSFENNDHRKRLMKHWTCFYECKHELFKLVCCLNKMQDFGLVNHLKAIDEHITKLSEVEL